MKHIPLNPGDRFFTVSGRVTEPFPKANGKCESRNNTKIREWIKSEYIAEAKHRFCDFNLTLANSLDVKNWSIADGECTNQWLFGEADGRIGHLKAFPA